MIPAAMATKSDEDWIRDPEAVLRMLSRSSKRHLDAWNKVPELLRSGVLTRQARGWYRVNDPAKAINEVGFIMLEMHSDRSGKITRIKLEKPGREILKLAALAKRDN